jgi:phenylalanyl-tRNA synthetase alpha chain
MPGTFEQIELLRQQGIAALAAANNESALLDAKGRYFGKKGAISLILRDIASRSVEERKNVGAAANQARAALESMFEERLAAFRENDRLSREGGERIDVTLPGRALSPGHRHPISRTMADIISRRTTITSRP